MEIGREEYLTSRTLHVESSEAHNYTSPSIHMSVQGHTRLDSPYRPRLVMFMNNSDER